MRDGEGGKDEIRGRERQRGRQGERFSDSNEIIEEAIVWASEGAEQKKEKKNGGRGDDFPGRTLVCECNNVRQHHTCILQQ